MAYSYEFSELAIKDINDVLNYISDKLNNDKAAIELLFEIEKGIECVCAFSLAYPDCKYYYIKDETVRHINIKNYIMFYKIIGSKVFILRFKYSKQNTIL